MLNCVFPPQAKTQNADAVVPEMPPMPAIASQEIPLAFSLRFPHIYLAP